MASLTKVELVDDVDHDRAVQLWALLHNGCEPVGRWTPETERYYEQVAAQFDGTNQAQAVLAELVRLKDDPRDDSRQRAEVVAWGRARALLAATK
ncbi:MAG: hypothetical protein ACRDTZ_00155 [Pseudonocardiaceae bacterium]